MIRKAIISVLTLAALGTLTVRALTHHAERAGGWSLRSSSWLGNRVVLHHRYIVFAHDKVLPGQIPDPEHALTFRTVLPPPPLADRPTSSSFSKTSGVFSILTS